MAIITTFQIRTFKEIPISVEPGTIEDGGFSTFNLDNPLSVGRSGTSDFSGIISKVVLIGEVIKETLDTGVVGIGQFNQLTQQDFQNQLNLGNFVYNPRTRGQSEVIGWVEIGTTYPSFYYEDCPSGKRPKSDNYFDLSQMDVSLYKVSGQGTGNFALQRTGNWNYGESIGRWGVQPFPQQSTQTIQDYLRSTLNGGIVDGGNVTQINGIILSSIPLLISNYEENFEGNNTFTLSPSFSNISSNNLSSQKTVYGRQRRTISDGFVPFTLKTNIGECFTIKKIPQPESGQGFKINFSFFVNDNSFTMEYGNSKVQSIEEEILYLKSGDKKDPTNSTFVKSPPINTAYSFSDTIINKNAINPFSEKYRGTDLPPGSIDPDQPPTDAKPDTSETIGSPVNYLRPPDSLYGKTAGFNYAIIRINPFRNLEETEWKQSNSLNIDLSLSSVIGTYYIVPIPSFPLYNSAKRIANSGLSKEEYRNRLIFIKEELISQKKNILK